MASYAYIFDHNVRKLAEAEISTTPRGYVLNKFSTCEFTYGLSDPLVTIENMQFGNLIHIQHIPSSGTPLPNWTGIILPPRTWDKGMIHVKAYSAEAILEFRALPWLDKQQGTPATLFTQIIDLANKAAGNIRFELKDNLQDKPEMFTDNYRLSAYYHILKLVNDAGMDWNVTGELDGSGRLKLYANLYLRRGYETDLVLTSDNTRLGSPMFTEQGTPANQVFGFSQSSTAQGRSFAEGRHESSIADYGALQFNKTFEGRLDEASVKAAAKNLALARGRPMLLFSRTMIDSRLYSKLEPGNTARIEETEVGFNPNGGYGVEAKVRMLSVDYNDLTDECPLNIEVI